MMMIVRPFYQHFLSAHPHESVGTFGDNTNEDDYNGRGQLENDIKEERHAGVEFRERLCARFDQERMARPSINWYRNQYNHTVLK